MEEAWFKTSSTWTDLESDTDNVDPLSFENFGGLFLVSGLSSTLALMAWRLHENEQVELPDPRLSEFSEKEVKRVIGVSLLCTHASAKLRPSMSRVVATLSGDVEVGQVTSKPGYLADLSFNDTSSFEIESGTCGTDASYYYPYTTGASIVADRSSPSAFIAILHENIRDNR